MRERTAQIGGNDVCDESIILLILSLCSHYGFDFAPDVMFVFLSCRLFPHTLLHGFENRYPSTPTVTYSINMLFTYGCCLCA